MEIPYALAFALVVLTQSLLLPAAVVAIAFFTLWLLYNGKPL